MPDAKTQQWFAAADVDEDGKVGEQEGQAFFAKSGLDPRLL
eukprot:SAG11_NODE_5359_length_1582_cov_8.929872_3_plen_40_part_01